MVEPINDPTPDDLDRWHRTLAPRFFNETWTFMDRPNLSDAETEDMLTSAFAQRAHWYEVGSPRNKAIADWQVSRAASLAGYATLALRFAKRSLAVGVDNELDPFVLGFAHEAIARAAAAVDDIEMFEGHITAARELSLSIADQEDRQILVADLDEMTG